MQHHLRSQPGTKCCHHIPKIWAKQKNSFGEFKHERHKEEKIELTGLDNRI